MAAPGRTSQDSPQTMITWSCLKDDPVFQPTNLSIKALLAELQRRKKRANSSNPPVAHPQRIPSHDVAEAGQPFAPTRVPHLTEATQTVFPLPRNSSKAPAQRFTRDSHCMPVNHTRCHASMLIYLPHCIVCQTIAPSEGTGLHGQQRAE